MSDGAETALWVAGAVAASFVVYLVLRTKILRVLEREILESPVRWDDALLRRRVPQRVALLLPVVLAFVAVGLMPDADPDVIEGAQRVLLSIVVLVSMFVISGLLNAADEIYEMHYAEVFDHLLAVVPEFGLRAFQNPTGADMARLAGATAELAGATHDLSEGS